MSERDAPLGTRRCLTCQQLNQGMCNPVIVRRTNDKDCPDLAALSPRNLVAPLTSTEIKQRGFVANPIDLLSNASGI